MTQDGLLFLVSGASGTGKGTILTKLKNSDNNIRYSISATTRSPRDGEKEGISYFFKSVDEFKEMISNNELIEWDIYCNNYYGTPSKYIKETLRQGFDIILELTIEGALSVMKQYPESVSVFILPPSFDELERRIRGRGTETEEVILKRLNKAKIELKQVKAFDYIIVNDNIDEAVNSFHSIIISEKLRTKRNTNMLYKFNLDQEEEKMIEPSINSLLTKVDCRYTLVVVAAKRARQITEGASKLTKCLSDKPVTIAICEINEDKISYVRTKVGIK